MLDSSQSLNSYDAVPYPSHPYQQTHPDHLAVVSKLLGLSPPRPPFRVLELGCASGGNLWPMAAELPDCQFCGIDASAGQIAEGTRILQALKLDNVQLQHLSILDVDDSLGNFDYIICHGVYSWVPADVQAKILNICRQQLSRDGIAYISYNTHPGWRQRGALREMMQYHANRVASRPIDRVQSARQLLQFLVAATGSSESSYARMLREQQAMLNQHSDAYIFHEHLEEHNEPLWFLDFCSRLDDHGLRYLGDADFNSMLASTSFPEDVQAQLEQLAPNLLEKEQYSDFLRNRAFRQSLVCHAHARPNYEIKGDRLLELFAASPTTARRVTNGSEQSIDFDLPDGQTLSSPSRSTQAAFLLLSQSWPNRVPVADLVELAIKDNTDSADPEGLQRERHQLLSALLTAYATRHSPFLELSSVPLTALSPNGSRELVCVSAFIRQSVALELPTVNRRHQLIQLQPVDRKILPLLDGTNSIEAVVNFLANQHRQGSLHISDDQDQPIGDPARVQAILQEIVPERIRFYGRSSLL